jgi:hypothetical protein
MIWMKLFVIHFLCIWNLSPKNKIPKTTYEHVGIRSSPFRSYGKMKQIIILVTARLDFKSAGRLEYNDISGEN